MPYSRLTLTALRQQVAGDINTNLAGADGLLRRANLRVVGEVQAGLTNLQFGYLDWIALQAVPFTATDEFLQGWAALKGITQLPANAAEGGTTFSGTVGTDIPVGTILIRSDGRTYISTVDAVVLPNGSIEVLAEDQTPGADGNTDPGSFMTLGVAIPGIQTNGIVTTAYVGGADVETPDAFRTRMLERYAAPPQGGATQDYVTWALAVPGVTRAWVNPNGAGSGTVVIYTMWDISEAAHQGFPQGSNGVATGEPRDLPATGDQLLVANYIFGPSRQPVTALVYSVSPIQDIKNFTIAGLLPNTTAMKTAVANAITDLFLREGSPGGVRLPNGAAGGTIYMADINAGVDAVPGIIDFIITSPASDVISATGFLAVLGTITWT